MGSSSKRDAREPPASPWPAYLIALAATAAAVLLRRLLDPWLGDSVPFITLFGAVAAAVGYGGYRPAIVATVVGFVACNVLFVSPRGTLHLLSPRDAIGLVLFLLTCAVVIAFGEALRIARRRAQAEQERLRATLESLHESLAEQRRAERAARESQRLLGVMVAEFPAGVGVMDRDGRWTLTNPLMDRYVPRAIPSTLPERVSRWRAQDPDGDPIPPERWPGQRALRGESVPGLPMLYTTDDGEERWMRVSSSPLLDDGGAIVGATCVVQDIDEVKRAQDALSESERHARAQLEELRALYATAPVGLCLIDRDFRFVRINQALAEMNGVSVEEHVGRTVHEVLPEIGAASEIVFRRVLETRQVVRFELAGSTPAGANRIWDEQWYPVRGPGGEVEGVGVIVSDITDRKRAEEALRDADRRKDEFLATLAHELRNPLAPILNAIQVLLAKGPSDPDLQWAREVIDRQVRHSARLLDDLLDVSRITHGKLELRREPIALAKVVESAVETSRPLIDRSGQELIVDLPPNRVMLDADPVRLAQVLSNLLNNAAKYGRPGGRIRLRAELRGVDLTLSVEDEGIGIDPEMLPRVFDLFAQAAPGLERSQGGLGIGLSLVRGLVELHGGSVVARSDGPGKGSEFVARMPIVLLEPRPEPAPAPVEPARPPAPSYRVLVVDDLRDNADSLAMLLKMMGHEVRTAYDGEEGVAAAATWRPEVVLLDLGLPRLSGYDVCRHIRRQEWGEKMILVALTGWGREDDRRLTGEAGFDRHLVKPVDTAELMSWLASRRSPQRDEPA